MSEHIDQHNQKDAVQREAARQRAIYQAMMDDLGLARVEDRVPELIANHNAEKKKDGRTKGKGTKKQEYQTRKDKTESKKPNSKEIAKIARANSKAISQWNNAQFEVLPEDQGLGTIRNGDLHRGLPAPVIPPRSPSPNHQDFDDVLTLPESMAYMLASDQEAALKTLESRGAGKGKGRRINTGAGYVTIDPRPTAATASSQPRIPMRNVPLAHPDEFLASIGGGNLITLDQEDVAGPTSSQPRIPTKNVPLAHPDEFLASIGGGKLITLDDYIAGTTSQSTTLQQSALGNKENIRPTTKSVTWSIVGQPAKVANEVAHKVPGVAQEVPGLTLRETNIPFRHGLVHSDAQLLATSASESCRPPSGNRILFFVNQTPHGVCALAVKKDAVSGDMFLEVKALNGDHHILPIAAIFTFEIRDGSSLYLYLQTPPPEYWRLKFQLPYLAEDLLGRLTQFQAAATNEQAATDEARFIEEPEDPEEVATDECVQVSEVPQDVQVSNAVQASNEQPKPAINAMHRIHQQILDGSIEDLKDPDALNKILTTIQKAVKVGIKHSAYAPSVPEDNIHDYVPTLADILEYYRKKTGSKDISEQERQILEELTHKIAGMKLAEMAGQSNSVSTVESTEVSVQPSTPEEPVPSTSPVEEIQLGPLARVYSHNELMALRGQASTIDPSHLPLIVEDEIAESKPVARNATGLLNTARFLEVMEAMRKYSPSEQSGPAGAEVETAVPDVETAAPDVEATATDVEAAVTDVEIAAVPEAEATNAPEAESVNVAAATNAEQSTSPPPPGYQDLAGAGAIYYQSTGVVIPPPSAAVEPVGGATTVDDAPVASPAPGIQTSRYAAADESSSPAIRMPSGDAQPCWFGRACKTRNCKYSHPILPDCRYGSRCNNPHCTFTHPLKNSAGIPSRGRPCMYGLRCLKKDCAYEHPDREPVSSMASRRSSFATAPESSTKSGTSPSLLPGQVIFKGEVYLSKLLHNAQGEDMDALIRASDGEVFIKKPFLIHGDENNELFELEHIGSMRRKN